MRVARGRISLTFLRRGHLAVTCVLMKVTIDEAGRLVVPKRLRDELGLTAGTEFDVDVCDGELRISVPSRVRREDGPSGARFVADAPPRLGAATVRHVIERGRR